MTAPSQRARCTSIALICLSACFCAPGVLLAQSPVCHGRLIESNGVGPIHIGMPVDSVRATCHIVRDTMEMSEGDLYREVYVQVDDDTVSFDVNGDRVRTILVNSPHFMTSDSIHVGMRLSRFLKGRQVQILVGEGEVVLLDRAHHCGNSFALSSQAYRALPLSDAKLRRLPASTTLTAIFVTDANQVGGWCQRAPPPDY